MRAGNLTWIAVALFVGCGGSGDSTPASAGDGSDDSGARVDATVPPADGEAPPGDTRVSPSDVGGDTSVAPDAPDAAGDVAIDPKTDAKSDGAVPVGSVGASGGSVARLLFAVTGDTRPLTPFSAYPTDVITKIFADITALSPQPQFVVGTGDYNFAPSSSAEGGKQLGIYLDARKAFPGPFFPTMGNHECTGASASNCGPSGADGETATYKSFLSMMLAPIGQTKPYYTIAIDALDRSWTSKFVFISPNAWDATQEAWFDVEMGKPTTYTFVVRHEPAKSGDGVGLAPSEAIMAKHPYTLALTGHTHRYERSGPREIIIGNGGAPLTGTSNWGYGLLQQRADGAIQVDAYDYSTNLPDMKFRFAVKADGSAAP